MSQANFCPHRGGMFLLHKTQRSKQLSWERNYHCFFLSLVWSYLSFCPHFFCYFTRDILSTLWKIRAIYILWFSLNKFNERKKTSDPWFHKTHKNIHLNPNFVHTKKALLFAHWYFRSVRNITNVKVKNTVMQQIKLVL